MKCAQMRSFFWSVFPAFGLKTERYELCLRIQSECGKIRTRENSVFGHFSRSVTVFRKYLLLKRFFYWKSSCLKEVPALKKYVFWIITYSEELVLQKYLFSRGSWSEKVPRSQVTATGLEKTTRKPALNHLAKIG